MTRENKQWDAAKYHQACSFVYEYGSGVLELLELKEGMRVLDIGCGTGALTQQIQEKGVSVVGVDSSEEMLSLAHQNYPQIEFLHINATELPFHEEFDAAFSNAVFHWISDQDALLQGISNSLKKGGSLVCEFGGAGCAEKVHRALRKAFTKRKIEYHMPFYFPTLGEYTPKMEAHGLLPEFAVLFPRFTKLNKGEDVTDWINMFVTQAFEGMEEKTKKEILGEVREELRPELCKEDGWYIDYVRIRLKARKL